MNREEAVPEGSFWFEPEDERAAPELVNPTLRSAKVAIFILHFPTR